MMITLVEKRKHRVEYLGRDFAEGRLGPQRDPQQTSSLGMFLR